ncbi:MAG TPA: hypothetical protein VD932_02595 [Aquabacterium sp.]|nr:hypothetical protein [Aquabacterium sp.]
MSLLVALVLGITPAPDLVEPPPAPHRSLHKELCQYGLFSEVAGQVELGGDWGWHASGAWHDGELHLYWRAADGGAFRYVGIYRWAGPRRLEGHWWGPDEIRHPDQIRIEKRDR